MKVRGKYHCHSNTKTADAGGTFSHEVKLRPVQASSDENAKFYNATPWGDITLGGLKHEVGESFVPGTSYYVDFTPADA